MKVLVTGGCGFIGSHLVDRLVKKGHEVRVLDRLEYQVHQGSLPDYLNPQAEYIFADVGDEDILKVAVKGVHIIFHEAAMVGVGQSMYEIERYVASNVMGTTTLLNFLVNESHDVKKLVVASSMSIYGEGAYICNECGDVYPQLRDVVQLKSREWEMKCPICQKTATPKATGEDKPLYPTSIYAITKRDQEEMCLVTGRAYGIPAVALRYFNVYGPRQSLNNPYTGVAAIFSSRIKNDNPPLIFEDGLQSRDFVSVHDIVSANLLVMDKDEANYRSFNVGTGRVTSIWTIAEMLIKLYGKKLKPIMVNQFRAGDIRHCYADISRIKKLGFEPSVALLEGMAELVRWGEKVSAEDKVEAAVNELREKGLVEGLRIKD
ncbi:MAG: nucleoside-diphosphate sugar epimerase [Chloroflexi bacterium RBG_16_50_9]|nr:MAG: nucleoside-diphosphate sugar epimerase [Chloroflexi bacterium RBG_16_50_9]